LCCRHAKRGGCTKTAGEQLLLCYFPLLHFLLPLLLLRFCLLGAKPAVQVGLSVFCVFCALCLLCLLCPVSSVPLQTANLAQPTTCFLASGHVYAYTRTHTYTHIHTRTHTQRLVISGWYLPQASILNPLTSLTHLDVSNAPDIEDSNPFLAWLNWPPDLFSHLKHLTHLTCR
jgi:hypothetical protein